MNDEGLAQRFKQYSAWRTNLASRIAAYRRWLRDNDLADSLTDTRIEQLLARLSEDKLRVAFVAEFSRGKTELINALFFADYGRRLLPSSAGRTTMCPTELLWDASAPPRIQLLPVETRATHTATSEYKRDPSQWTTLNLDLSDPEGLASAFQRIRDTKRVAPEVAHSYGLGILESSDLPVDAEGLLEIPAWRYAIINFPHPLLDQGILILDTPGLNAIGTEPELTLNLLPNAHAVLFILACDTGVTQTDAAVWREHLAVAPGQEASRQIVLNKIDSLWDGLRSPTEIDAEIEQQKTYVGDVLRLPAESILAISAQKGLLAKITQNKTLLSRSRLPDLERKLADDIVPRKQQIVSDNARATLADLLSGTRAILEARAQGVGVQLEELRGLRGRNRGVVEEMMSKVGHEKQNFDVAMRRFQSARTLFTKQSTALFSDLGIDLLNEESKRAMTALHDKWFTPGLRTAMKEYFDAIRARLESAERHVLEIYGLMQAIYAEFKEERHIDLGEPLSFSVQRYVMEVNRLEQQFQGQYDTRALITIHKHTLLAKFFETVIAQMRQMYQFANRDTDAWLRAVMAPLEGSIREHQGQMRRRLDSIKRIHRATDELEDRVGELEQEERQLNEQLDSLRYIELDMQRALRIGAPIAAAA